LTELNGLRINHNIKVSRAGGKEDWYSSKVQDINDTGLYISVPVKGLHPMVLSVGETVIITFLWEMSRYEFETQITGWRHDNIPLYELALPEKIRRIQLREFVRVSCIMEVEYAEIPEEGRQPVFRQCDSLDLSGGGIRLLVQKEYPVNTKLMLKWALPFQNFKEQIEVIGKVVRSLPERNAKKYLTGIQFEEITRRQQDLIVRYVLRRLSEQRRLS